MKVLDYIKIIRPLNLLIIAVLMVVTRYCIISSFLDENGMVFQYSFEEFLVLVLSVVFLSAFGYVANDISDLRADKANNKSRILVLHPEWRSKAENFSFILFLIGIFLGLVSWIIVNNWMLVIIHFFAGASLHAYSKYLKKTVLIGNISIALLCAVLPLIVFLFDLPAIVQTYYDTKGVFILSNGVKTYNEVFFKIILNSVLTLCIFIFLVSLVREIIKDVEDEKGDAMSGYRTLTVRFGTGISYQMAIGIDIITLILLFGTLSFYLPRLFTPKGTLITISVAFFVVGLPLLQSIFLCIKKRPSANSKILKIGMIGAIVLCIVFGLLN